MKRIITSEDIIAWCNYLEILLKENKKNTALLCLKNTKESAIKHAMSQNELKKLIGLN